MSGLMEQEMAELAYGTGQEDELTYGAVQGD
jgi:hypothetical protein